LLLNANQVYKSHEKHALICATGTSPDFAEIIAMPLIIQYVII